MTYGATDDLAAWPTEFVQQAAAQLESSTTDEFIMRKSQEPTTSHNEVENPKALVGRQKAPLMSPVPSTSLAWLAEAHRDGAQKYGVMNWREIPIKLSDYIDAAIRHLLALKEGEDFASDSLLPHAAHVMATMSIVLDAAACGTLIDDRKHGRADALAGVQAEILAIRGKRAAALQN